jgi:hypothetical protein
MEVLKMSNNNKEQFLSTSRAGNIICPACGNPMSMREFASYQLVFTSKARQALNTMVTHFVNFLTFFDDALLFHDQYGLDSVPLEVVPYQVGDKMDKLGFFTSPFSESVKVLCRSQESLAVLNKIRHLPKTQDSLEGADLNDKLSKCYSLIYGQIAPYDYVASLFEITDQQYAVQHAIQGRGRITPEDFDDLKDLLAFEADGLGAGGSFNGTSLKTDLANWARLVKNLQAIAPGYARYIGFMLKLAATLKTPAVAAPPQRTAPSMFDSGINIRDVPETVKAQAITGEEVANCVMKFAHVLNVFLCGGYIEHDEEMEGLAEKETPGGPETNGAARGRVVRQYRFGLNSVVQDWETLGKFITSYPAVKMFEPYWPKEFVEEIKGGTLPEGEFSRNIASLSRDPEPGSPSNIEHTSELLESIGSDRFLGVVSSVVDFACRGQAMTLPDYLVRTKVFGGTSRPLRKMARNWIVSSICGWCPSDRNAHSLVLLGGTGSGKSSIAQSGLVALSDSLSQFGYSLSYPGPVDEVVFDYYHHNHYKNQMPSATEEGARYTLTLSLEPISDPLSRVDLVFTDVAGEKMEAALLGGAEDPVVLGALRSAKTFVYLFDFVAWQTFASTLSSSALQESWRDFVEQKERLNSKSRAVRDSFEMLKAVVNKIYEIRKQEGAEDPYSMAKDCDFIITFPKADLYWKPNGFLSNFFDALKNNGIILESLSSGAQKFVSRGISPRSLQQLSGADGNGAGMINPDSVLKIAKTVSEQAKKALTEDFHKIFSTPGSDTTYIEGVSLPAVLQRGIIEFLEERFNRVYFFPVSAQGYEQKLDPKEGNKGVTLETPAAQALCEFVFLIAAASAMKSFTSE